MNEPTAFAVSVPLFLSNYARPGRHIRILPRSRFTRSRSQFSLPKLGPRVARWIICNERRKRNFVKLRPC